jgi:hypothetical protein
MKNKICCTCKKKKAVDKFSKKSAAEDGLQSRCKNCVKDWYPANHQEHKKKIRSNQKIYRKKVRFYIIEWKKSHPCSDCQESDPIVLEFDHIRDKKKFNIGEATRMGYSLDALKEEIAKCEVVCANCHRRRTAKRQV